MKNKKAVIVVAGHTCLDVIPTLPEGLKDLTAVLAPGQMLNVGPMVVSTGGSVSNTGLALHRLGTPVRLVGKLGGDVIGRVTMDMFRRYDPSLSAYMVVAEEERSSYTAILSAPNVDRTFMHYSGPNDTFCTADIPDSALKGAVIFHFGYPSLMRRMYEDEGRELARMMRHVRQYGLVTSLDISLPDPTTESGQADWRAILARTLPYTDVFLPNVEEALFMLDRDSYERAKTDEMKTVWADANKLEQLAKEMVHMGAAVVVIKLGSDGLFLRTTSERAQITHLSSVLPIDKAVWVNRQLATPTFQVNLVGTTGAGDCAVAGFLTAMFDGLSAEDALVSSAAVGACNVEAMDAISGIPSWDVVQQRIQDGWTRLGSNLQLPGWVWESSKGIWMGPVDRGGYITRTDVSA
ncbi:MAG: carbohydrate kinase family protein [Anaerolineae bacterium]|nr:carbohydrate kinase family protein [Anaerolineae bacterium]